MTSFFVLFLLWIGTVPNPPVPIAVMSREGSLLRTAALVPGVPMGLRPKDGHG